MSVVVDNVYPSWHRNEQTLPRLLALEHVGSNPFAKAVVVRPTGQDVTVKKRGSHIKSIFTAGA